MAARTGANEDMGKIITLTTDFGTRDYFSGGMKGVILGINPEANIVDITHEVPSQDIWGAAYILGAAYGYFPPGTVHVVVVDPGVGSARRPIMAVTDKYVFIGPDNGVLSFVYQDPGFARVLHINASHYFLPMKGSTFHAREVFAPIAAWLTKGIPSERVGDEITDYVRFAIPAPRKDGDGSVLGEVVYFDKFGNSITNITSEEVEALSGASGGGPLKTAVKDVIIDNISPFYASVEKGGVGAVINGNGYLEIYINQGDARRTLGLKRGEKVKLSIG